MSQETAPRETDVDPPRRLKLRTAQVIKDKILNAPMQLAKVSLKSHKQCDTKGSHLDIDMYHVIYKKHQEDTPTGPNTNVEEPHSTASRENKQNLNRSSHRCETSPEK